jgi:hypothetical protein
MSEQSKTERGYNKVMATSCPRAADLDAWSQYEWSDGLQIDRLSGTEQLSVRTRNSVYEITVVRPFSDEVLVRGGAFFPNYTAARVGGCSLGGSFLKARGIYVGFRLELLHEGQTIITTEIESIEQTGHSIQ